jgi:very-short-patch-repair endonuclease
MSHDVEARILGTAAGQHGIVTRAQLLATGLSSSAISRRLSRGLFRPLHRGVYLVGPLESRRSREMAAVMAAGAGAVVSHLTAVRVWTLIKLKGQAGSVPVDISVQAPDRGSRRPGLRIHRVASLPRGECVVHDGIPVTTPGRTLIDVAGTLGHRDLERAVARAERAGLVEADDFRSLVSRHEGRPGVPQLRAVLELQGGPAFTRSEAEARFLELVRRGGLPRPRVNERLGPYEIDFLWPAERLAVEVDGFGFHSSRSSFEGDRRKDAWLLARGIRVLRLTWKQIAEEALATIVQVTRSLHSSTAGQFPGGGADPHRRS